MSNQEMCAKCDQPLIHQVRVCDECGAKFHHTCSPAFECSECHRGRTKDGYLES